MMTDTLTFPPAPDGFRWEAVRPLTFADDGTIKQAPEGVYVVSIASIPEQDPWLRRVWYWLCGYGWTTKTGRHYGATEVNLLSGNVKAELITVATKARHQLQAEHDAKVRAEDAKAIAEALRNAR